MNEEEQQPSVAGARDVEREPDRALDAADGRVAPRLSFPVVGVGASAGGLEAFFEFFDAMPPEPGMAFVLVQHLPPERESLVADLLSKRTAMPVHEVRDGMPVEPNHVYVIRPGRTLTLHEGLLHLGEPLAKRGHSRPVDDFFTSLAEEQRERAICIVLSGMGSNGGAGAQRVKAVGGLCIAQDPETAKFPSMPQHTIELAGADFILRPREMPEVLLRYVNHPYASGNEERSDVTARERRYVDEILAIVRTRTKHDFAGYKRPTITRRIQRRMGVHHVFRLDAYAQSMRQNPTEAQALADDLLIHVTGFFRDPEAWDALAAKVIAPLVAQRETGAAIRCWVTACATGEEAYTLAMLLTEAADAAGKQLDIKVFATDMAHKSVGHAREGLYPNGIENDVSQNRLDRFFDGENGVYRVKSELRELVVFAAQDLLRDPPFSRIDLCTCRNLLIYLEPETQAHALAVLHFGLSKEGVLFLGTSETTAGGDDLFRAVDKRWRIFRRVGVPRKSDFDFTLPPSHARVESREHDPARVPGRPSVALLTTRALLGRYAPVSVTVDRDCRVVYFHGETERYLLQPRGEPTRDLLQLAREGLRGTIRAALDVAFRTESESSLPVPNGADGAVVAELPGDRARTWITVAPIEPKGALGFYVVSFERRKEHAFAEGAGAAADGQESLPKLRDQLDRTRDDLQRVVRELQASNEELRASNKEATSVNEELQSTNEKLETSKEELQSLNEELTTLNAQLHVKMQEHETATSDLSSLLRSTDIAVLFLDRAFHIRRFTPAVRDLLDLIPSDVGRPLANLAPKFDDPELLRDAADVLERLVPIEKEVGSESGRWYARRILPYRTSDNRHDGVVITFVDITVRKRSELASREKARLLDLTNDAIIVRDMEDRIISWNQGATDKLGWAAEDALGRESRALLKSEGEPPIAELVEILRRNDRYTGEVIQTTRDGRRITSLCRWALDRDQNGSPKAILTSMNDITELKRGAEALREREDQFRFLVEEARDFALLLLDPDGRVTTWNVGAERLLGFTEREAVGHSVTMTFPPEDRVESDFTETCARAARDGRTEDARWHVRADGTRFFGTGVITVIRGADGVVRGFVQVLRDDTARKLAEDTLMAAAARATAANRMKDEFLATLSHELRTPLGAIQLWVRVLQDGPQDAESRAKGLAAIEKSARAQKQLIDDLLDTSRIVAGTLRVALEDCDLAPSMRSWVEAVVPGAESKGVHIELTIAGDVGVVASDPDRLQQVVWNLVSNGVKFTAATGRVDVSVRRHGESIELRVSDTGRGISPEFLPHVFEPFRQNDASATRTSGGLGLGLAIVAKLVDLLGGTIRVMSPGLGKGSTFVVRLPVRGKAGASSPSLSELPSSCPAGAVGLARLRVLLVEDTDEAREAVALLLRTCGAEVQAISNAADAYRAFEAERPDVVLSDVAMPDEDGYGLLRRIRNLEAQERSHPRVPAIALSALAREEDRADAVAAGFDTHMAKPFETEQVVAAVLALVAEARQQTL